MHCGIVQVLPAALFLFAGGIKLVTPMEEMMKQLPLRLPGWFVLFTGVVELLGAIGSNPSVAPGHTAGSNAAGRCRTGDRYDRRDGVHIRGWAGRVGADPAGRRDPLRVRRLWPLAGGAVMRLHTISI